MNTRSVIAMAKTASLKKTSRAGSRLAPNPELEQSQSPHCLPVALVAEVSDRER
jgi:hypothetical protein